MKAILFTIMGCALMFIIAVLSGLQLTKPEENKVSIPFEFVVFGISEQKGIRGYSQGCMIGNVTFVGGQIYETPNQYEIGDTIRICGHCYGDDELVKYVRR